MLQSFALLRSTFPKSASPSRAIRPTGGLTASRSWTFPASSETGASVSWTFPRCSTSPRRPISAGMSSGTWASPLPSIGDSLNYFYLALRYTMDPSLWYFSEICLSASIFQSQTFIYRCKALHHECGQNLNAKA